MGRIRRSRDNRSRGAKCKECNKPSALVAVPAAWFVEVEFPGECGAMATAERVASDEGALAAAEGKVVSPSSAARPWLLRR